MGNLIVNTHGEIYPEVILCNHYAMDKEDRFESRRQLFEKVINERCGGSIRVAAEMLGIAESYVSRMLYPQGKRNKKNIGDDMMSRIDKIFPGWIPDERRIVAKITPINYAKMVIIPIFNARGLRGMGGAEQDHETIMDDIKLSKTWVADNLKEITSTKNLATMTAKGNSMSPTFNEGDILIVDTGVTEVAIDGIYVFSINNNLYVKTIRRMLDGKLSISSDNPTIKSFDVYEEGVGQPLVILGRVRFAWNSKKL